MQLQKSSLKWLKGYKPNEKKTKKQYRQEQADGARELPAARSKKKMKATNNHLLVALNGILSEDWQI